MLVGKGPMPLSLRTPPRELRAVREDVVDDSVDVPAAVICAVCGDAGCLGCEHELSRSGIVSVVAWERPGAPALARLWATARATTIGGDTFFELLPDGPIAPALRFAVITELLAAMGLMLFSLPLVALFAPPWIKHLVLAGGARDIVSRVLLVGVPALALLLVAAHAAHGLALDYGARGVGAASARTRALRFGLYATGWDLLLGPIGALVLAAKEGLGAMLALFQLSVGLPGRCTRAFLRGCYRLEGARVEKANRSATAVAIVATLMGAVAVLIGAALLLVGLG
jgi:hypothetical protein